MERNTGINHFISSGTDTKSNADLKESKSYLLPESSLPPRSTTNDLSSRRINKLQDKQITEFLEDVIFKNKPIRENYDPTINDLFAEINSSSEYENLEDKDVDLLAKFLFDKLDAKANKFLQLEVGNYSEVHYSFDGVKKNLEFLIKMFPDTPLNKIYDEVEYYCQLDDLLKTRSEKEFFDLLFDLNFYYLGIVPQKSGTMVRLESIAPYYFVQKLHQDFPNMKDNIDEDLVKKLIDTIPTSSHSIKKVYEQLLVLVEQSSS